MSGVRWIVPLKPGPVVEGEPAIVVEVDADLRVNVEQLNRPNGRLPMLDAITACRLGQALQEASRHVGQALAARRRR